MDGEERRRFTAYLVESAWVLPSIAIPVGMFIALILTTVMGNIHMPGMSDVIDPARAEQTEPFTHLGVRPLAQNYYEAVLLARTWSWTPSEVRVPVGAIVHFHLTSKDVIHGFIVDDTTLNLMVVPGRITHATYQFTRAGTYRFQCHEYCGVGHQAMAGQIIVEGNP